MSHHQARHRVLAAGIFSLILTVGVARFAYTPLLPLMQAQAGLGVSQAGWLAALNYAGYLSGALLAATVTDWAWKDRLYRGGLLMAVLSTALMGLSTHPVVWAVARYLAGLSSAAGMLLGTGLILNWLMRHQFRSELGLHFSGLGLGIVVAAGLASLLAEHLDWRTLWWAFAALGGLLLLPAWRWLPPPPKGGAVGQTVTGQALQGRPPSAAYLRLFVLAYFCAGFGFVVTTTFIVAILKQQGSASWGTAAFLVIGLAAAPACMIWDRIARRIGDLSALTLAAGLQIIGIVLPLAPQVWPSLGLEVVLLGAALFGGTFIGMVSLVLTMAGRFYPGAPAKMMGKMTLSYGVAQIIGPLITAGLAQRYGGYGAGLVCAAGVMALGTLVLLLLRWQHGEHNPV